MGVTGNKASASDSWFAAGMGCAPGGSGSGGGDPSSVVERHHLLPKQFEPYFKRAGLDVEDYTMDLPKSDHRLKPDGLHTGPNNWNKQWGEFFDEYPHARKDQILQQLDKMMRESGLT